VWCPPELPGYEAFRRTFPNLPAERPAQSTITRTFKWDWVATDFFLRIWGVSSVFGVLYIAFLRGGQQPDLTLHFVLCLAIGLTAAAALCISLWLLCGGWGPPAPWFFGMIGVAGGLFLGLPWLPLEKQGPTPPTR